MAAPTPDSDTAAAVRLPSVVLVLAVCGALVVIVPLLGVISRVPLDEVWNLLTSPDSLQALHLSVITAAAAACCCLILGLPLALVLARSHRRGIQLLRALVLLPLVLPPVVGGLALLMTYGRQGLAAPILNLFGIDLAFSTLAVICAQTFVSLPFMVLSLEGALAARTIDHERVAASLGAGPWRVLTHVTLPLIAPAVLSGTVLAFARSLGEFGATLTFAGSLPNVTRTLPLEIYRVRETDPNAAAALSLLLVVVAILVVLVAYGRRGRGWTSSGGRPERRIQAPRPRIRLGGRKARHDRPT
ncbi:ABC transporter permease [Devriesea agamarum]|uniref:ABC transporter permease n=1 Tax=Devriesea agamarum TaxID=472569 RepID=UPI000A010C98|nr:ABC transporter permease [Devriesea agamarum]